MNPVIPPKIVALLRNAVALAIAIPVSYSFGVYTGTGYLEGWWMVYGLPIYLPWLVMLATKREVPFGILMSTVMVGHFAILQYLFDRENRPEWLWPDLAGNVGAWVMISVLSLFVTIPIYLWRRGRRRQQQAAGPSVP